MASPRGHLSQLEKIMIMKVHENLKLDFPQFNTTEIVRKTSAYTGCSVSTVNRVRKEERVNGELSTPKKARRENVFVLDEHQKYLIRRTAHQFFFENKPPTLDLLLARIKENEEIPKMSRSKLYSVLKELNFTWSKRARKSLLIERDDIVTWRRRYLREIKELRKQGRPIFYLDETWINAGHTKAKVWIDGNIQSRRQAFNEGLSTGLQNPSGKGRRLIILHIGNEDGFVDGGLLLFEGVKSGDYHDEMNAAKFEEWFGRSLQKIPPNGVIVMDNASYHSRQLEKVPTTAWRKQNIQDWLKSKNVAFDESLLKVELLALVNAHKPAYTKYVVDEMAVSDNKLVLRLPPYHCELNPIELIWAQIKNAVAANNTTFKMCDLKILFQNAVNDITANRWKECVSHVIKEEEKMWKLDGLMETAVENLIINLDDSSGESDWPDLSDSDKENAC